MGSLSGGSLSREGLCPGGLCPGESLYREGEVSVGGLCLGVSVRGISVQGVSVQGSLCTWRGRSLSGGLCPGVSVKETTRTVISGRYVSYWNAFLLRQENARQLSTKKFLHTRGQCGKEMTPLKYQSRHMKLYLIFNCVSSSTVQGMNTTWLPTHLQHTGDRVATVMVYVSTQEHIDLLACFTKRAKCMALSVLETSL